MALRPDDFLDRTARILCELARRDVRQVLQSRTLRNALRCRLETPEPEERIARLEVPHYWAVYYHDGRGPVKPRKGKFIVYFRDVEDDPRLGPATASPERHSQTKKLSLPPSTFRRLVAQGKLIVRKGVGPTAPRPFFKRLDRFQNRAAPAVNRLFSRFIRDCLRDQRIGNIQGTARPFLRATR